MHHKYGKYGDGEFWQADPSEKLPNVCTLFPLPITHCSHRDVKLWAVCPTDYSAEVTDGMDVADKIVNLPRDGNDCPQQEAKMIKIGISD